MLVPKLRDSQLHEMQASGISPGHAFDHCIEKSFCAEAAFVDGDIAAVWGAARESLLAEEAYIWMLGTDYVSQHPRTALKIGRCFTAWAAKQHPRVCCFIDAGHAAWIKWAVKLGFEEGPRVNVGHVEYIKMTRGHHG